MKRTIACLLTFALCLGLLAGCGETAPQETAAPQTDAGEEVYTAAFRSLTLSEDSWLQSYALTEDALYLVVHEKLSEGTPPEGETLLFEGQYDTFGSRLYRVEADGTMTPLAFELPEDESGIVMTEGAEETEETPAESAESAEPAEEPTEQPAEEAFVPQESNSRSLEKLLVLPDGGFLALEQDYRSWYDGPAGKDVTDDDYWQYMRYEESHRLLRLDAQGQLLSETELTGLPDAENSYLNYSDAVLDGAGRLLVGGEGGVFVFDAQGAYLTTIQTEGWINSLTTLPDGRVIAGLYGMQGLELREVDAEKGVFGEMHALDGNADSFFAGSGDWDLLFTNGTWLYGYSIKEDRAERLVDLLSCDLLPDSVLQLVPLSDGALRAFSWDRGFGEDAAPELVTLTKTPRESVPERTVLTLGALDTGSFSRAVLAFNRSQEKVRIELRDYSEYLTGVESEEDYSAALTKLGTEIISGAMPDLLSLDGLPYKQLAVKGLLEDLYPYLDADPELKREDLFESVLKSMEVGGKLCEISPVFNLTTLMGATSVVGEEPGWTYDELNEALARMPEGCTVLGPFTGRDEMLQMCLFLEMDRLVNWETGECRFDSEDFLKLLDFVKGFPQEIDYEGDGSESDMSRIAAGKQMLMEVSIYDLDELVWNEQIFGGEATYKGFPTSEGVGNVLYVNGALAMSSRCADKDAAWQFMRQLLSPDYNNNEYGGLPINKARMDALLAEAMKVEYERDENGNYKLDPETGERIPMSRGSMGMSMGGDAVMEFEIWPMTEAQRDKLLSLINESTRSVDMNQYIYTIVRDETAAFFAGQKSAEEVARLIQSKVSLYVNEQR